MRMSRWVKKVQLGMNKYFWFSQNGKSNIAIMKYRNIAFFILSVPYSAPSVSALCTA